MRWIVLFLTVLGTVAIDQLEVFEQPPRDQVTVEQDANVLEGTWRMLAAKWEDEEMDSESTQNQIKIFSQNRFAVVRYDNNDSFIGASGGTYILHGDEFTEYVEYNTWDTALVDFPQTFEYEIDGNLLVQKGFLRSEDSTYSQLEEIYERVEPGMSDIQNKHPLMGVWKLEEFANGDRKKYEPLPGDEAAYKFITPQHYYIAHYHKNSGELINVSFGEHLITPDYYIETVKSYSSDSTAVGKEYVFSWEIEDSQFQQKGIIDSDKYMDYKIDEHYLRIQ